MHDRLTRMKQTDHVVAAGRAEAFESEVAGYAVGGERVDCMVRLVSTRPNYAVGG